MTTELTKTAAVQTSQLNATSGTNEAASGTFGVLDAVSKSPARMRLLRLIRAVVPLLSSPGAEEHTGSLDSIRERLDLTRTAFAERLGVSLDALRRWEQGKMIPALPKLLLWHMEHDPEFWLALERPEAAPENPPSAQAVREMLGPSRDQLARALGIDVSTISRWEGGQRQLAETVKRLLTLFHEHPGYWRSHLLSRIGELEIDEGEVN